MGGCAPPGRYREYRVIRMECQGVGGRDLIFWCCGGVVEVLWGVESGF